MKYIKFYKESNDVRISKMLSLVLRHKPEQIGISLDRNGWADTNDLIKKLNDKGFDVNISSVENIVANSDKKRFIFNDDHSKIRANQGHSIEVDLQLIDKEPPNILYHGTKIKFLNEIKNEGLKKMKRHSVHLSPDMETATIVANRRTGESIILVINSGLMFKQGYKFQLSENGVWLTDIVPPKFINFNNDSNNTTGL